MLACDMIRIEIGKEKNLSREEKSQTDPNVNQKQCLNIILKDGYRYLSKYISFILNRKS